MSFDFKEKSLEISREMTNVILKCGRITTKEAYEKFASSDIDYESWKIDFYKAMDDGTLPGFKRDRGRYGGIRLAEVSKVADTASVENNATTLNCGEENKESSSENNSLEPSAKYPTEEQERILYPKEVANESKRILRELKFAASPRIKEIIEPAIISFKGKEYTSKFSFSKTCVLIKAFILDQENDSEREDVIVKSGELSEIISVRKHIIPYLDNVLFLAFGSQMNF